MRRCLLAHPLLTAALGLCAAASVLVALLPPLVLGRAVDCLAEQRQVGLSLALGYFGLLALSSVLDALREGLITAVGEKLTHALRSALSKKLDLLPASYFTAHESGEITSILVGDVDTLEDLFSSGILSMAVDLGTMGGMLAVIFTKSRGLFLLLLPAMLLLGLFTRWVQRQMLSAHLDNRRAVARLSAVIPQTIRSLLAIHVFSAQDFWSRHYDGALEESYRAVDRTNFFDAVYSPVVLTASAVVTGALMGLAGAGGRFRALFGISVGTAVTLISYVRQIFAPIESIGMEIQTIQSAMAGIERIRAFLALPERPIPAPGAADPAAPAVQVSGVTFGYAEGVEVLSDFSLTVREGEQVTLMGRTGAGKSTLFALLLGLYSPQKGYVRLFGLDPRALSGKERRRLLSCVPQRFAAVPGSVREQVTLGDEEISEDQVLCALQIAGIRERIQSLPQGLDTPFSRAELSHGEEELLQIARAVVADPKILLLDEITAGLDVLTQRRVMEALARAGRGRCVLSIAHREGAVLGGRVVRIGAGTKEEEQQG